MVLALIRITSVNQLTSLSRTRRDSSSSAFASALSAEKGCGRADTSEGIVLPMYLRYCPRICINLILRNEVINLRTEKT